ncbi:CFAH-like protein [Mya arenaria]|uniref:CFAH-like protein n=1 Tax=Mya arenaria TaxID=6604 RepID=A0ABY7FNN0_MYAAR|nr:CFAH-like protein [Mya arenaria]
MSVENTLNNPVLMDSTVISGIDESEEVSVVVEDRDGNSTTTSTTVDVDNPADCDKVFLFNATGTGPFNYVIINDTADSTSTTETVTVIVENLVIPSVACDQVPSVKNGSIVGGDISPYFEGQNVTYNCTSGYTINGTTTISCNGSGVWPETPSCLKGADCAQVPSVLNGSIVGGDQSPYVEGQNVTYNCTSGYIIIGTTTISCNGSGVWPETPSCLKDCDSVPSVLNAGIVGGNLSSYVVGQTVTYTCTNGFTMMGTSTVTCDATGAWTEPPSCERDIGSSCSSDAECQIILHTQPYVCDNTVCKFELILSSPSNGSVIVICESTEINEVIANLSASFAPTSTDFVFNITDPSNKFTTANATIIVVSDLDVDVESPVTSYALIIELSHPNSSRTVSTTITISVEDDNDNAPEFGSHNYTFIISEQSTALTAVGTIAATDKDSTSPNNMIANYKVIGTNKFEITSDGVLSVSSGESFNYTTTPFYTFLVMATDGALEDMEMSTNVSVTVNIIPATTTTTKTKRRGERANIESRCLNDISGQYKPTLPVDAIQTKEGHENNDNDDPKNLNDIRATEIHQNDSPLSETETQTKEDHKSSDNDGHKSLNDIRDIEIHHESPLSEAEIQENENRGHSKLEMATSL